MLSSGLCGKEGALPPVAVPEKLNDGTVDNTFQKGGTRSGNLTKYE